MTTIRLGRSLRGMAGSRHPAKEIEAALREVEALGWLVEEAKGGNAHSWGSMKCPANKGSECRTGKYCWMPIFSTPRGDPGNHARELFRKAKGCLFLEETEENDNVRGA